LLKRRSARDQECSELLISLLLPIGRLSLESGLGSPDLVRAAKHACVRAAIAQVVKPGERINVSRLSVVTGLTRKEVATIVSEIRGEKHAGRVGIKEQRAMRVARGWMTDPRFVAQHGLPARLPLRGQKKSFASLVGQYGGDVTPNSVLRELERMNLVASTKSGELRLRSVPSKFQKTQHLLELTRLFPDFADTVTQQYGFGARQLFFGFRESVVHSPDQAARFQRVFSDRAAAVLQSVEQWIRSHASSGKSIKKTGKHRVGIGVYLIQSDIESQAATRGRRKRRRMG
jgi:hypothetical protein